MIWSGFVNQHTDGVERGLADGVHEIVIVGLPDAALRESRDRVVTVLIDSGFTFTFPRLRGAGPHPLDIREFLPAGIEGVGKWPRALRSGSPWPCRSLGSRGFEQ